MTQKDIGDSFNQNTAFINYYGPSKDILNRCFAHFFTFSVDQIIVAENFNYILESVFDWNTTPPKSNSCTYKYCKFRKLL